MAIPKLLVSVQNVNEAQTAATTGADIIDLKNPDRGSLGMADSHVIAEFLTTMSAFSHLPTSVALGEVNEHQSRTTWPRAENTSAADAGSSLVVRSDSPPAGPTFVKLGLSGSARQNDWQAQWRQTRAQFSSAIPTTPHWIAVIYADAHRADAVSAPAILDEAVVAGCRGVLVDTFCKQSGRLTEVWTKNRLQECRDFCSAHGFLFAVAGRLQFTDIVDLRACAPDIIAVRSAVCEHDDRGRALDGEKIRMLKRHIERSFKGQDSAESTRMALDSK